MPKVKLIAMGSRREDTAYENGSNAGILYSEDVRQCEHGHHSQETKGHTSAAARSEQVCSDLGRTSSDKGEGLVVV